MNAIDFTKFIPTRAQFDQVIESTKLLATIDKPIESFAPQLTVLGQKFGENDTNLTLVYIADDFNETAKKHNIMMGIGQKFYQEMKIPLVVSFISEAWLSQQKKECERIQPRDDPQRQEALVIFACSLGKEFHAVLSAPIVRNEEGLIVSASPLKEWRDGGTSPLLKKFFMGFFLKELLQAGIKR